MNEIITAFHKLPSIEKLTVVLVVITACYALVTLFILFANRRVVSEMRKQREDLIRPYINIHSFFLPGMPILGLSIANVGKTSANNLRLKMDRDFYEFGELGDNCNLKNYNAFQQPIECFSPGGELIFYLAQGPVLFAENVDQKITPHIFNIQATYTYLNKTVTETTNVDLRQFLKAAIITEPVVTELEKLRKEITEVKNTLKK